MLPGKRLFLRRPQAHHELIYRSLRRGDRFQQRHVACVLAGVSRYVGRFRRVFIVRLLVQRVLVTADLPSWDLQLRSDPP